MPAINADDLLLRLNRIAHDPCTATDCAREDGQTAFPPLTAADISAAESKLGFSLPPLLSRIFTEVGNGGFGPGYGLLPLSGLGDVQTVVSEYLERIGWNKAGRLIWPRHMLPIADHGCGEFTCLKLVESGDASPPVITYTPNLDSEEATRLFLKNGAPYVGPGFLPVLKSFPEWISDWVDNRGHSERRQSL